MSNEELEISKEELQSLNEELSTVNVQLEEKLHQLERANNDLNNLLSEIKRGEEHTRRLATVVADSFDAIIVFDFAGRILAWNHAAERIYGYSEAEALQMNVSVIVADESRAQHDEVLHGIRIGEPPRSYHTRRLTKDGRMLHVWVTLSILRDQGRPAAATTERDETERMRNEEELRIRSERLLEADAHKDEFLAMLAHELRNPLAPIRNAVESLRRSLSEEKGLLAAREVIDRQVQHLSRLVDDLLDAARITRGQIALRRQPITLAGIVERAVELAQPQLEQRNHRLRLDLPVEPVMLECDITRVTQVLGNLIDNAAKYTADGGDVVVSGKVEGDMAVLCVRDTGMGIPPDLLPRIFDLFTQCDRSLDRSQGGLGIGLTLVRQLVELHGGTVAAHSDGIGKGAEFVLRLPVARIVAANAEEAAPAAPYTVPPARPRRVLLVDDNIDTVESMAALLDLEGHDVRTATAGPAAIELAKSFRPHAVVLDIGLPVMDGYEVAEHLRRLPHMKKALLLAVTGYDKAEDHRRSADAGFDHHLVKPVDPAAILALLAVGRAD